MKTKLLEVIEKGMETEEWIFIGRLSTGQVRTISSFPEGSKEYLDILQLAFDLAITPCDDDCIHRKIRD